MSEITELEDRLASALGRIATALARPVPPPPEDPELARLREALEAEKVVTGQLEARIAALHDKAGAAEAEAERFRQRATAHEALVAQLRRVNAQLRENNAALRAAHAEGLADAGLIDRGMLAELESIRAAHAAERAEVDAVLAELEPLVKEGAGA